MDMLSSSIFWVMLAQIIMINIVLSGDNAVVIALASRSLPPKQQKRAIVFGSMGAIVLRVILTFFAVYLLSLPYLKLIGAALLLWIGTKMLVPDEHEEEMQTHTQFWGALRTIIVADFVMSLDNVIGVAAAAKGNLVLLILGLGISIPLIIYGSTLILKVMTRFPIVITLGAGLLGWVAGEMAASDPAIHNWVSHPGNPAHTVMPIVGATFVVILGKWLAARATAPAIEEGAAAFEGAEVQTEGGRAS